MQTTVDKIRKAVSEKLTEPDFVDCFLIDVAIDKRNKVTVFIDAIESFTLRHCQRISRFLEERIETEQWLPEKYTLEVSSPGADKPLTDPRQYHKHKGRNIELKLENGQSLKGTITETTDTNITIEEKKKEAVTIAFDDIASANILISFNKPKK